MNKRKRLIPNVLFGKIFVRIYIIIVLLIIIFPLLWLFSIAFREKGEVSQSRFLIIPINIETGNFKAAIVNSAERGYSVPLLFKNSTIITFTSIMVTILIASIAGYAFAKFKFAGKRGLFYFTLLGMMIPMQILIIPIFLIGKYLHIINTHWSLILPYIAFGLPISIFIMRGFFLALSNTIIEAARIDGATEFGIFLKIALPIAKPAIATCVIFLFLQNWNEFMLALVLLLKKDIFTIPVGIAKTLGEYVTPWGEYTALIIITIIPVIIVYAIFQNWFIKGLSAGSIKG